MLLQDEVKGVAVRPEAKVAGGASVFVGGDYIRQQKEFLTKLVMVGPTQGRQRQAGQGAQVQEAGCHSPHMGTDILYSSAALKSYIARCDLYCADPPRDQPGIVRPWGMPGPGNGRPPAPAAGAPPAPAGLPPRPHTAQPWPAGHHTPDIHAAHVARGLASGGGGGPGARRPAGGVQLDPRATELAAADLADKVGVGTDPGQV
jgi:hypothetical protein